MLWVEVGLNWIGQHLMNVSTGVRKTLNVCGSPMTLRWSSATSSQAEATLETELMDSPLAQHSEMVVTRTLLVLCRIPTIDISVCTSLTTTNHGTGTWLVLEGGLETPVSCVVNMGAFFHMNTQASKAAPGLETFGIGLTIVLRWMECAGLAGQAGGEKVLGHFLVRKI